MALQILQSRLFSVTSWYHLSFLVISMAMFGLTLGALKVYRGDEEDQRRNYGLIARKYSMGFGIFSIISLITQLYVPIISSDAFKTTVTLPVNAFTSGMAYYFAGVAITVCLTRAPFPVGKTYGADLIGAGLGCLAALFLMETIDTPSAILILSGMAFLSAMIFPVEKDAPLDVRIATKRYNLKKTATIFVCACFGVGMINAALPKPLFYPLWTKDTVLKMSRIDYEGWNSISRVTVFKETSWEPYIWGRSPVLKTNKTIPIKFLIIDGDAGTPITKFDGDYTKHDYLEYDITNIAYYLPDLHKAAIIGVGGGRDVLSAKYFGVENVTALDVNPVQVHLLRDHPEYREYANLYKLPGVTILNEEARSWFRKNTEKLDIIQMSLIDTWAATGAGAFALSENGLYTTEAWEIFMHDLSDHGVFTLSRWSASMQDDTGRALSVAMATLFNQGVKDPRQHLALFHTQNLATLVMSKSPFTKDQIDALRNAANDKEYQIILLPGQTPETGVISELINAHSIEEIKNISDRHFFDITPSTDMRPFFFNQAPLTKPWEVINLVLNNGVGVHHVAEGQAKATFNLYLIIVFAVLMVGFVIIRPLLKTVENKTSPFILAGTLYFMLIGLGFMFMEISLLQALGVFLGHPIYGLSVVLFSLIMSAGVGSFISEKIPLETLPRQLTWSLFVFSYGIAMSKLLPDMFHEYAEVSILTRVLISIAVMAPIGLLMGFGFPTGLRLTERFDKRATAWFWGINGATGVLGSSLAIAFNIAMGIDNTLVVAGSCYALLGVPFIIFYLIGKNKIQA
jgi:predicted membrane-bound spermidine synthase